jgi:hypothetical protein
MGIDWRSPACNPGFLDTLTWDEGRAARAGLDALRDGRLGPLARAVADGYPATRTALDRLIRAASRPPLSLVPASACAHPLHGLFLLGVLTDGQHVLVALTAGRQGLPRVFGRPLASARVPAGGGSVAARLFAMDLARLRAFLTEAAPAYRPAVPDRPGLGIGCRMGILDVPVAVRIVGEYGLCASGIQSSVYRELAPLADLVRLPLPQIDLPGVGRVPLGHTGMSITGQYLAMMTARIALGDPTPVAADADHLPLRSATGAGRALTRRLIREAADRSLFTLDPHFCFYGDDGRLAVAGMSGHRAEVEAAFRKRFSPGARRDLAARYVGRRLRVPDLAGGPGHVVTMSAGELADSALRFQEPLAAIEEAVAEIRAVKAEVPFAVEVSVDEAPGMSEPHHFFFLGAELERRGIRCFSLAPGLGFSKLDVDVEDPRGAFAARVRVLAGISRHFGAVMGIHSGDGKSVATRRILARATGGSFWYKISPDRQRSFFTALGSAAPGSDARRLFGEVYRAALARVVALAVEDAGETARVARQTLRRVAGGRGIRGALRAELTTLLSADRPASRAWRGLAARVAAATPAHVPGALDDHIVHDYAFATVGARDASGTFRLRGRLLTLPDEARRAYERLDRAYLADLVRSLGLDR